jgi:hypothetical protein
MGSPLSPVITNFYKEDFERKAIANATHKLACWYTYVDNTFMIWPHGQDHTHQPIPTPKFPSPPSQ